VARALRQAQGADLRLLVVDAGCAPSDSEYWLAAWECLKSIDVVAYSKCDLPASRHRENDRTPTAAGVRTVRVSGLTGAGWFELEEALLQGFGFPASQEPRPLVFCGQLHEDVAQLASALGDREPAKAVEVLEALVLADATVSCSAAHRNGVSSQNHAEPR
jgi:tRNA U34 5-carboxymethylaminomethyl modifying GTPase MnmE/TrmE